MLQLPTGANTTTRLIQSSRYSVLLLGRQACFTTSRFQKEIIPIFQKKSTSLAPIKVKFMVSGLMVAMFQRSVCWSVFNIEQKLFNLYACRTQLEIDVESIEDIDLDFDSEDDD